MYLVTFGSPKHVNFLQYAINGYTCKVSVVHIHGCLNDKDTIITT